MFGKKKVAENDPIIAPTIEQDHRSNPTILLVLPKTDSADVIAVTISSALTTAFANQALLDKFQLSKSPIIRVFDPSKDLATEIGQSIAVVAMHLSAEQLDTIVETLLPSRKARADGTPSLIIVAKLGELSALGAWLHRHAVAETLDGVRLITGDDLKEVAPQLAERLSPVIDISCIKMPVSTEVDNKQYKYFYTISDSLRALCRHLRELAQNNITRIYFLGGPGTGKTSLAYYFWLCRGKGNFITVNLNSETTDDKAAMKSLLCGHVTGAFPGAQSREGALSFARDGVCFLDESHGVSGQVMQVLMECLENNQYLPYGATAKRAVDCAVLFASNRSWQTLRSLIHLDEHARLGATVVKITDLASRLEDLIAVLATTIAGFEKKFTTWRAPVGLTKSAWEMILNCKWRGHTRTLIRVTESAVLNFVKSPTASGLIDERHIQEALLLWEPNDSHQDDGLYTSFADDSSSIV